MNAEFEKISSAIDGISSLTEALRNTQVDPDPYWKRSQAACEQCAQPARDALLIVMSSLACDVMYEAEVTTTELSTMARSQNT